MYLSIDGTTHSGLGPLISMNNEGHGPIDWPIGQPDSSNSSFEVSSSQVTLVCVMSMKTKQHEDILENSTLSQFLHFLSTFFSVIAVCHGNFDLFSPLFGGPQFHALYFIYFYVYIALQFGKLVSGCIVLEILARQHIMVGVCDGGDCSLKTEIQTEGVRH